jgi:4-hydroxy-3-methylbut-2-en-1-yl diphosphate synthase IspG/GcpE
MTGMWSCNSAIALFGWHVKIVQLKTSSPLVGDFHFAHKPAITICESPAMAMAWGCFSFPLASTYFHS